jgi:hypothetical protein
MGAGASTIPAHIDKDTFRQLCGGTINDAIFDANSVDGVMTRDRLMELSNMRDCFLSYSDGADSSGRNIVERVQRINAALKARGLMTWMGERGVGQQVIQQVCSGIDKSRCMITFLTRGYIDRVLKNSPTDNCSMEFNYNLRRKHPHNIIPVVLEKEIMNPATWTGPIGVVLGEIPCVNMVDEGRFDAQIDELYQRVILFSKAAEKFFAPESALSNSILSQTNKSREEQQFFQWMARSTNIEEGRRIIYCASLVKAGISSVFSLAKAMKANPSFLQSMGVTDPDADQVAHAVRDLGLGQVPLPDFSHSMTVESVVFAMQKAAKGAEDPRLAELALGCAARVATSHKIMPTILSEAGICESILKLMTRNLGHAPSMENGCLAVYNMIKNDHIVSAKFGSIAACDVIPRTIRSHIANPTVVYHGCNAIAVLAENKDNRNTFCQTGAPDTVVTAMVRNMQLHEVVEKCVLAANSLGEKHLENVGKLGLAGACEGLTQALAVHPDKPGVVYQSFKLIVLLSVEPSNRAKLGVTACCTAMMAAFKCQIEVPEIMYEGCRALCCILLGNAFNRAQMGAAGGCEVIKAVVQKYHTHPAVAEVGCAAVFALAAGSLEHKQRFNGLQPVVQGILNHPQMPPQTKKEAKEALLRI